MCQLFQNSRDMVNISPFTKVFSKTYFRNSDLDLSSYQVLSYKRVILEFSSVQFSCSVMSDSLRPHESQHARPPCPSPTPGVHSDSCPVMPSSQLILCCPLLLLPPIPPSIRVFSNVSTLLMRWPKYWSVSFSIIPSKEIPGLISFRMDWLDLLAVQGTLKSLLQHHSSKASILELVSSKSENAYTAHTIWQVNF